MRSSGSLLKRTMRAEETPPVAAKAAPDLRETVGRSTVVHGVLVQLSGLGILILGDSGIGKTACGLDLVSRGGVWIADDVVVLERREEALYGRGHGRIRHWIAIRERGILEARDLLGGGAIAEETQVQLLVRFIRHGRVEGPVRGGERPLLVEIEGISLPCRRLAVGGGAGQMADEVVRFVEACLVWRKRGFTTEGAADEADARSDHYGTVRFR